MIAKIKETAAFLKGQTTLNPRVAIVLGSGLGGLVDSLIIEKEIPYSQIPNFPVSTVKGHKGALIFGTLNNVEVVVQSGRFHYYEGYDITDVVLPTRVMKMLGAEILFLTNASGGINYNFEAGDLMLMTDHISMFAPNPLIGANIDELGTRFPDMSEVYDKDLRQIIIDTAIENKIPLKMGVYAQLTGPSFESPAEIKMLRSMGVSAVGMSTVVEAIAANHMGARVCGVSCISNLAAGMSENPLTHEEVQEAADKAAIKFELLVTESVKKFGNL